MKNKKSKPREVKSQVTQAPIKVSVIDRWSLGITLVFALVVFYTIFIPPLGIKTGSDFGRIMDFFNLYYQPGEMNWSSFHAVFNVNRPFDAPHYGGYFAASSIFLALSFIPNYVVRFFISDSQDLYYIVCLGAMYFIVYVLAFYFLISAMRKQINNKWIFLIISLFMIWALSDILFVEYFNSFFQEPALVVGLLLFVAVFLRFNSFTLDLLAYGIVIFSKQQNFIFILLLIPIFIKYQVSFSRIMSVVIITIMVFLVSFKVDTYQKSMNDEDGVLSGLLHNKSADEAKKMLTMLGLDPELYVLAGRDYWGNIGLIRQNPQDVNLITQFQNATSITKLDTIKGYLYFPKQFVINYYDYMRICVENGPLVPYNYSIYDDGTYFASYATYFSFLILKHLNVLLLINLAIVIVLPIVSKFKQLNMKNVATKNLLVLFYVLNVLALIIIPVNFVGDGFAETVKHTLNLYFLEAINMSLLLYILSAQIVK